MPNESQPKTVFYDASRDRNYIVGVTSDGRRYRTYAPLGDWTDERWPFSGKYHMSGLGPDARWYELRRLDTGLNEPQAWAYEPCEPKDGCQQQAAEDAEKVAAHAADAAAYAVKDWVPASYIIDQYPNYLGTESVRRQNAILGANMSPSQRLAAQLDGSGDGLRLLRKAASDDYEIRGTSRTLLSLTTAAPHRLGGVSTGCEPLTEGQQIAELWRMLDKKGEQLSEARDALRKRSAECRALRSELRLMRRVMRLKAEVAAESCEFGCKAKGAHRSCPIHGDLAP